MKESLRGKSEESLLTAKTKQPPISAVLISYNEGKNIEACLESIRSISKEIMIVDSGSTDRTLELARRYTNKIYTHPWENGAAQWNWALENVPISNEWVLALDADQRLSSELQAEIQQVLNSNPKDINGFYLCRRQIFRGRWIQHGGYYPKYLLKLFRSGTARCDENELQDCRFYVEGKTTRLRNDLIEDNRKDDDLSVWRAKHERFAKLQAQEEFLRRRNGSTWKIHPTPFGTPDQRTLWLKNIWYHLPLYVRPYLYFFYRYFLRLGFLDGREGLIFHFFQGFWYRLLVDIHLDELRRKSE